LRQEVVGVFFAYFRRQLHELFVANCTAVLSALA
jgi:hypothetical protein